MQHSAVQKVVTLHLPYSFATRTMNTLPLLFVLSLIYLAHGVERPHPRDIKSEEASVHHDTLLTAGYVRLPNLLEPREALQWGQRVSAASAKEHPGSSSTGAPVSFQRARRLEEIDPGLSQLTHSVDLARVVAKVMNVSRVRLYQATAFIKRAGDGPSVWHQDAAACPLHTDKLATLWIALDHLDASSGTLQFARGSHLPGVPLPSLRDLQPKDRVTSMRMWGTQEVRGMTNLSISKAVVMAAGDATLHLGWTLHAAPPNLSREPRPALAITYFADGARVHPNLLEEVGEDYLEEGVGVKGVERPVTPKGVTFKGEDGKHLVVHLLEDDVEVWKPWLHNKPSILIPGGAPVRNEVLTPLLYDALWDLDKKVKL